MSVLKGESEKTQFLTKNPQFRAKFLMPSPGNLENCAVLRRKSAVLKGDSAKTLIFTEMSVLKGESEKNTVFDEKSSISSKTTPKPRSQPLPTTYPTVPRARSRPSSAISESKNRPKRAKKGRVAREITT